MPPRPARHASGLSAATAAAVPLLALASASVAAPPISIDGAFDDWKERAPRVNDPADAAAAPLDLRGIRADADGAFLHFMIETTRPACLQGLEGRLELVLDADGDPDTGMEANGVPGVDLGIVFTPADRRNPARAGSGVGLQVPGIPAADQPDPYVVGLQFSPTYAGDRIEIRLDRGVRIPGARPTGRANRPTPILVSKTATARFTFRGPDGTILDDTEPFTIDLPDFDPTPPAEDDLVIQGRAMERPPDSVRVMSWNAERGVMMKQSGATSRLLRGTNADIVLLQELTDDIAPASVERLFEDATRENWTVSVGRGGGNLRCVAATRLPAAVVTELDPLTYPDRPDRTLRTAAILVDHPGGRVLAVSVHLKCCGKPGDRSDTQRIAEAGIIRTAIVRAIAEHAPDAVVIAGDLNLVGTRTPLDRLMAGTDVDGSELVPVDARQPVAGRSNATWSDAGQPYTPGRLDWILVSDRSLRPVRGLILNGAAMEHEGWRASGIDPRDTLISDHFPVIADLQWRR